MPLWPYCRSGCCSGDDSCQSPDFSDGCFAGFLWHSGFRGHCAPPSIALLDESNDPFPRVHHPIRSHSDRWTGHGGKLDRHRCEFRQGLYPIWRSPILQRSLQIPGVGRHCHAQWSGNVGDFDHEVPLTGPSSQKAGKFRCGVLSPATHGILTLELPDRGQRLVGLGLRVSCDNAPLRLRKQSIVLR